MRPFRATTVFVFSLLCAGAASAEDARAVLDRAIAAHGGAARLERTKRGHLQATMEGRLGGVLCKVECEETFDLPDRYRRTIEGSGNGMPFSMEYAFIGKKGWIRQGILPARDTPALKQLTVAQHWQAILALLLSLCDKDVQLAPLPDETKGKRTLAGIRATTPQGVGDFYFDKSTGLLARTQKTIPNLMDAADVKGETVYEDYRDIQGIHYPMKWKVSAGETAALTITLSSIEFRDKIDESVFLKPQTPDAANPAEEPRSAPSSSDAEKSPVNWDRVLIVATLSMGVVVGALWFLVRASKRGKRETPPG